MIPSLKHLQAMSGQLHPCAEQLRVLANSIESQAQAMLTAPVGLMSTAQQLIAALCIIQKLVPQRRHAAARWEKALRQRQGMIQEAYRQCNLERDAAHYDIANRAAHVGVKVKVSHPEIYAEVVVSHAASAAAAGVPGAAGSDSYLEAQMSLAMAEAMYMAGKCEQDPLVLQSDKAFWAGRISTADEKPLDAEISPESETSDDDATAVVESTQKTARRTRKAKQK